MFLPINFAFNYSKVPNPLLNYNQNSKDYSFKTIGNCCLKLYNIYTFERCLLILSNLFFHFILFNCQN